MDSERVPVLLGHADIFMATVGPVVLGSHMYACDASGRHCAWVTASFLPHSSVLYYCEYSFGISDFA